MSASGTRAKLKEGKASSALPLRFVDHLAEGVDLVFRLGPLRDSWLVAHKLLTYCHQLVASPGYVESVEWPEKSQDLPGHRLLSFSFWRTENSWTFIAKTGVTESITGDCAVVFGNGRRGEPHRCRSTMGSAGAHLCRDGAT